MARIVVSGYMMRHPVGGNLATFLQWVIGLDRLGHDVLYVEEKGWPYACFDPTTRASTDFPAVGLERVRDALARHAPAVTAVWVDTERGVVDGMARDDMKAAFAGCDLFLDVGGNTWLEERLAAPHRALVDLDPLFTQVGRFGGQVLDDYHVHFTVGTNVGDPSCLVPSAGCDWIGVCPPVVVDLWRMAPPRAGAPATTVANWSAYEGVEHDGIVYGQKDTEFLRLVDLPGRVPMPLVAALDGAGAAADTFRDAGWEIVAGSEVSDTLDDYRAFIAGSQAELSPAKHGYVASHSGWISDRTACYLAAGRPAVVQDTSIHDAIETGRGLLTFSDADEAVSALEDVASDLHGHARAARELVNRHFDHRSVLPRVVDLATAWRPTTVQGR
jgi:hypothetical protein